MKLIYFIFLFVIVTACTKKQEVAQWRGENRNGIFEEEGLLKTWPENGPAEQWSIEGLGDGYGSVAVTNDKIFVNGEIDSVSHLFAFNLDGTLNWKATNGPEFMGEGFSASFPGARSTPTVIDDLVYVTSGLGRLACYDANSGEEKWGVDMKEKYNGIMEYFGYGESVLIDGDKVFCYPGGSESNIVTLNRFTGEEVWVSKALADSVSHCSPMIVDLNQTKVLVYFSQRNLIGLDAENGEVLWSHQQERRKYSEQSNTPVYDNGNLYYVAGDGNGAVKLEISEDGRSIKEQWSNDIGRNSMNGIVVYKNKLYSAINKNKLFALDTQSGEVVDSLKIRNGSIILADEMLYCYSDNGDMQLVDVNKTPMEVVGKFKIEKGTKHHFARPAIKNGVLYIRRGDALMAYTIKE